jgi:hypothetical protein
MGALLAVRECYEDKGAGAAGEEREIDSLR